VISSFSIKSVDGKVIFRESLEIVIRKSIVYEIIVTGIPWFLQGMQ